jgi:hypothetical protein
MKRTVVSLILGLVLAAIVSPIISYASGCYNLLQATDPETGEQVNCYLISNGYPCRYRCPGGDVEWGH